jgi:uncharacterized membrane protein HdeD (DUF308 family)
VTGRRILGAILVVVGLVALLWGGISWTRDKTVLDAGPIKVQTEERERIPLPPVLGAVSLVGGILLLVIPARGRA